MEEQRDGGISLARSSLSIYLFFETNYSNSHVARGGERLVSRALSRLLRRNDATFVRDDNM